MGWGRWSGLLLALVPLCAAAQSQWGPQGSPIRLTVGYQTYRTEAWSAAVIRAKHFHERYLPQGSTVRWEIGLHGPVILTALQAGGAQIGYLGDQTAINAVTHPELRDLRLIAAVGQSLALCNNLLVRADAPAFADPAAAIGWLEGRRVSAAFDGCADRFAHQIFEQGHVKPAEYLNMTSTVLKSAFRSKLIDAAIVQEPIAANLIALGLARRALTGADLGLDSGSFLVTSAEFLRDRPDVVKAWLEAELDAEEYMADPAHAEDIVAIAADQTIGYEPAVLKTALYGDGEGWRMTLPYAFTPPMRRLLDTGFAFQQKTGRIEPGTWRDEAIVAEPGLEILRRRGITPPVGEIRGRP